MNKKFEEDVKLRANGFTIEPNGNVWQGIQQELDKRPKRRFAIWWWLVPVLGIISGIVFYSGKENTKKQVAIIEQQQATEVTNIDSTIQSQQEKLKPENIVTETSKNNITPSSSNTFNIQSKGNAKGTIVFENKSFASITTKKQSANNSNPKIASKIDDAFPNDNSIITKQGKPSLENKWSIITDNIYTQNPTSSNNTITSISLKDTTKKSAETAKPLTDTNLPIISKNKKKIQWGLQLSVGSNAVSNSNLFSSGDDNKSVIAFSAGSATSATPGTSSSQTNYAALPLPKVGSSFAIGVTANIPVSKIFTLQTGLLYKYKGNKTNVGADSLASDATYYTSGNQFTYQNNNHQLEIPVQLIATVNPKAKTKFSIVTGVQAGINISSNFLISNNSLQRYSTNQSQGNNLFAGIQTGLGLRFSNNINLQLVFSQTLTAIHNSSNKNYWRGLEAKAWLPFSLFNKSK